jgi:hypothetical protein
MKFVHPSSLYFSHPRLNANEGTSFEERRITDIIGPHASRHQSPDRHYRHSYSGFPPLPFHEAVSTISDARRTTWKNSMR